MTAKNRAALIGKLHTALKKHFKPAPPSPGRPLMEHVLYASLLEDSPADLADEGFAKCEQEYFDWNEVRVTTVTELAEVLNRLPNPQAAALRLKRNLQSIFETFYNFDIDFLKKENLGKAVAKFESMTGMSPFVLAYIIQHGLGGHSIPVDKSSMKLMWLCGIVSDAEADSGKVPGIERTIPKNKSIEFSSLLHQAAIAFQANNKEKSVWDVLLAVNKDAKALFERPVAEKPKSERRSSAKAKAVESPRAATETTAKEVAAKSSGKSDGKSKAPSVKPAAAETPTKPISKPAANKPVSEKAAAEKTSAAKSSTTKAPQGKPASAKPAPAKPTSASKPASTKSAPASPASEKKPAAKPAASTTKPASSKVAAPSTKSAKGSEASSKPASSKSTTGQSSTKKPEAAPKSVKKESAKKPVVKPEAVDKKSEKKSAPPTKKSSPSEKAAAGSTNKKLTKQKPR